MQNNTSAEYTSETDGTLDEVSQSFHIGAIFIVLVASFLGVVAPSILVKRKLLSLKDWKFTIGKAFSAGIILGVGFIHMLPEAQNQLNESLPDYPYSGLFAGLAAVVSLMIEQIAFQQLKRIMKAKSPTESNNKEAKQEMVHLHFDNKESYRPDLPSDKLRKNEKDVEKCKVTPENDEKLEKRECKDCNVPVKNKEKKHQDHEHEHGHDHVHEGHTHGVMDLYTDEELLKKVNSFTIAHVLEIGVAFHSIIIGIALSVESGYSEFQALLIAICFHQFFEGFALGSSIQGATITSILHLSIMTIIFTISTPVGQAIGLGVATMYEEDSPEAQQTQGIFDSISGGILIYMALVDLIGEDFKKSSEGNLRYWMVFAVMLGLAFMAILALWA